MDEHTGFRISIGINMEVISSSCNTAPNKLSIILKIHGKQSRSVFHVSNLSYSVMHINSLFCCWKKLQRSIVSNWHIMKIQRITAALFYQHVYKFITGHTVNVLACITDGSAKNKPVFLQQLHGMHYFAINAFSTPQVIDFRLSFQTKSQKQISDFLHLMTKLLIYKSSIGICKKHTVVMFFAECNYIFLAYHRFSACQHIEVNAQFFSLSDNRIHFLKGKIQLVSILCGPTPCTMEITGAGGIHKNDPRNIAVMYFTHFTNSFCTMIKSLIAQVQKSGLQNIGVKFIHHGAHVAVQCILRV